MDRANRFFAVRVIAEALCRDVIYSLRGATAAPMNIVQITYRTHSSLSRVIIIIIIGVASYGALGHVPPLDF